VQGLPSRKGNRKEEKEHLVSTLHYTHLQNSPPAYANILIRPCSFRIGPMITFLPTLPLIRNEAATQETGKGEGYILVSFLLFPLKSYCTLLLDFEGNLQEFFVS